MFYVLVKKTAIFGLSLGLLASPLAFAHMSIKANQDFTIDDEPIQAQSQRTTDQADFSPDDLMYDVGDRPAVIRAESTRTSPRAEFSPRDLMPNGGKINGWW